MACRSRRRPAEGDAAKADSVCRAAFCMYLHGARRGTAHFSHEKQRSHREHRESPPVRLLSATRWRSEQKRNPEMPAKSAAQQKAAGAALSAKRGETKVSDLDDPAKSMYESMSEAELEDMAGTSRKDKPEHDSD